MLGSVRGNFGITSETLVLLFWFFPDPSWLKIILFLLNSTQEAYCANKIAVFLGMNRPAMSQHLGVLKDAI
jgi:DNA-binding transcriptional ArsR family regulator